MKVRYFVGFRVGSEVKPYVTALIGEGLQKTTYEESLYLGLYLEHNEPTMQDVLTGFEQVEALLGPHRLEIPPRLSPLKLLSEIVIG